MYKNKLKDIHLGNYSIHRTEGKSFYEIYFNEDCDERLLPNYIPESQIYSHFSGLQRSFNEGVARGKLLSGEKLRQVLEGDYYE